ncbi:aldehyde dehydrogenase family protein [Amycolatopsis magusensis]|uniref:aldehyde dehydrogenase family protein n=1 Tax=Amycolatopsis magusensis TaxID=882444 RepID=UPI0037B15DD9
MTGLEQRLEAVRALGRTVTARAAELEELALAALGFPRRVIRADIDLAARRLAVFGDLLPALRGRGALGSVSLALPGNAILSNPVAAAGSAYLAGNQVRVRFPRRRKEWADVVVELLRDAFGTAIEPHDETGAQFLGEAFADPDVRAVLVFGADDWMLPYEDAARLSGTKVLFEGPGKDPFLVLRGANLAAAAGALAASGTYNSGRACSAPERVYVDERLHDRFTEELAEAAEALPTGEPGDERTWIGPLLAADATRVRRQVELAVAGGARVLSGGSPGTPTVLVDVDQEMEVMQAETFGPVLPVLAVADAAQAVAFAEDSPYGLGATVYGGPDWVPARLARSHGAVHRGETWLDHRDRLPLAPYGGRRRSGWVWEWRGDRFTRWDGPRSAVAELSSLEI